MDTKTKPRLSLKSKLLILFGVVVLMYISSFLTSLFGFNESYYERISSVELPTFYDVVETADNWEFVTTSVIDIDESDSEEFIRENNFQLIRNTIYNQYWPPYFEGVHLVNGLLDTLPHPDDCVIKYKEKVPGEVGFVYLFDTKSCRLYCEIKYPDMGGN
jgi:hypothetical protein